ncbi:LuxR C-terminal-related transcriptional regulator [Caulobacter sp. S45]|uniref:LuxR C-terminal-related transcriptional regulator n=1 Tax=Caulobacter sp. S45 TaxID=1641861 RepID=UPI00131BC171|nr:LuxR C-terminal-related transcriptional regulator [Caulobacter sp. S45]
MDSAARIGDSRFSPPQQHVHLIQRPALTGALEEGLHRRLVLVQAPAGYGKSTLLAQWRDSMAARGVRAVWLTLDEDCGAAAEFLAAVILAAAFAGVRVEALEVTRLQSAEAPNLRSTLTALLAELDRDRTPVVFILDDYHLAQNSQTDALLDLFVRRMPESVHLVLASRSRPGLALPQLRAQGQIREVGSEQLRFSLNEAFDLLREDLPDEEIVDLTARLEGWPIALQLAAVWVRNHGGGAGLLQAFSGSVDDMGDYLATQVLAQLPVHLQTFLLETSIFDRFNSSAADAARGAMDSALMMEELRRFNIILIPVDKARTWWRHHNLMAEFLASRRGQLGAARLVQMHEGASAWFETEGSLLDAVRHARAAQDRKRMVALIEDAGCVRLCLEEGFSRARALFALLTPAEIEASARLRLVDALALFQAGKFPAGDRKLEQVRRMVKDGALSDEGLRSDLLVVEALRATYSDELLSAEKQEALEALCSRSLDTDPWFSAIVNNLQCVIDLRRGEIESAKLCGQKALGYFREALNPYGCVFMHIHLGSIAIVEERLSEASNHLHTAEELVFDHFRGNVSLPSIVQTLMAQIAYARNNLTRAADLLTENLTTISTSEGWSELYASGYSTSALLWLARGDDEAAEATFVTATELLHSRALPQLNLFLTACRANLLGRTGRVADAGALLAEVEAGLVTGLAANWAVRDEHAITRARLNIMEGLPDQALKGLESVVGEARRQGRIRSELRAETLRVLALAAQGQDEAAAQTLLGLVERTRGEGERRMFIDEGPAMAERLRDLVRRRSVAHLSPATLEHVADLLSGFGELTPGDAKTRLLATLTPREHEILRELVRGGSNKVIARAIDLNENAVKFHLKNIFRKLGVAGRGMAVTMAEKLDLLS